MLNFAAAVRLVGAALLTVDTCVTATLQPGAQLEPKPTLLDVRVERVSLVDGAGDISTDWRFVDTAGRERLFRGVNVVYKDPPWLPTAPCFNTNFSWVADDAKLLASMGFNLIRLGVMWPGVNPDSLDNVNMTYIAEIKKLIAIAAAENIYTMIDPHQDEMNPRFCGEGAPNWWVLKHTTNNDFPVPVRSKPFPVDKTRPCPGLEPKQCPGIDFPGRENCDGNSSFSYIWTHDGAKAYQTLWENPDTGFSQFWTTVARELHDAPGVIGGELWNEPFPGDVFGQPEMRKNQHADLVNLAPFYRNVTAAIREAVPDQKEFAIAWEPTWPVGDQDINPESLLPATSGFEELPEDNGMYAFHWYVPPANKDLDKYLDERLADAKRLHAAPYASEWNFGASSPVDVTTFFSNVASFESRRIAYTGWQYKNYQGAIPRTAVNPTCTGCGSSFFHPDGSMRRFTFEGMSAPFAQSVAGRVLSIEVSPLQTPAAKRQYKLEYMLANATAPSEIIVSSMWLRQEDLAVKIIGDSTAEASIEPYIPAAKLTDGVSYKAAAKVVVKHMEAVGNSQRSLAATKVIITITSK